MYKNIYTFTCQEINLFKTYFKLMKRQLFYFLVSVSIGLVSNNVLSQHITLSNVSGSVSNGGLVSVHGLSDASLIEAPVYVTNSSTDTLYLKLRKIIVDTVSGSSNTFCFGLCYAATVYVSPNPVQIPPGVTLYGNGFDGEYYPAGHEGVTTVRYLIFNINNLNDTASFTVSYAAQLNSVAENTSKILELTAYPNPANNMINIDYNVASSSRSLSISFRDILGRIIREMHLNSNIGNLNISTESFENGIYFYSIMDGDKTLDSKKMIIKH